MLSGLSIVCGCFPAPMRRLSNCNKTHVRASISHFGLKSIKYLLSGALQKKFAAMPYAIYIYMVCMCMYVCVYI